MKVLAMNRTDRKSLVLSLLAPALLLCLGLTGCCSFQRDWKSAARVPVAADDIQGRWEGTWLSDRNGHTDQLRCLLTKTEAGVYQARFRAKYEKIFTFSYTVPLQVTQTAARWEFQGDANLGWYAGGRYHYEGQATPTNFFSTYRCPSDHGTFRLARPASGK